MKQTDGAFNLSLSNALAVLRNLEGESELAVHVRASIREAAAAVQKERIVLELRKAAEALAAGKFLFPGEVEDVVLDAASLMASDCVSRKKHFDFWLKDPSLQVLAGIQVTDSGAGLACHAARKDSGIGNADARVYGLSLSDWEGERWGIGRLWPQRPDGTLEVKDEGFSLRVGTPRRFAVSQNLCGRSVMEVAILAAKAEGGLSRRILGKRKYFETDEAMVIELSSEDVLELAAFAQDGAVLRADKVYFPFGADFMESGLRRGWRRDDSGLLAGCGTTALCRIKVPASFFPEVVRVLRVVDMAEDEFVKRLLDLQAEAAGIG